MVLILALLKIASLITAVTSAWLWWRASKVPLLPGFALDDRPESGDPYTQQLDVVDGYGRSLQHAADLNRRAALWAAAAALASGATAVLS